MSAFSSFSALTLALNKLTLKLRPKAKVVANINATDEVMYQKMSPYFQQVMLNRPNALNSLNMEMVRSIQAKVDEWNGSKTRLVWFVGMGGKAFCSGGDIKMLWKARQSDIPQEREMLDIFPREEYMLDYAVKNMKPFQVSVFDGIVMGGGAGISIHSKAKITTEKTVFAMPEAKIGLYTDVTASYFFSRIPNNLGLYLALTGTRLRGKEMVQAGLANYYVERESLNTLKNELIGKVTSNSTDEQIKGIIKKYNVECNEEYPRMALIKEIFSADSLQDVYRRLENNKTEKDFCLKTLEALNEQCPLSLRVIFEAIKRGKHLPLDECLKMEFRLTRRFMQDTEFFEGVRCTLINKNDKPQWKHKTPFDVTNEELETLFSKLPQNLELKLE